MRSYASRLGTLAGGLAAIAATAGILIAGATVIREAPAGNDIDFVLETPEVVPDFEETESASISDEEPLFDGQDETVLPAAGEQPGNETVAAEQAFPRQVAPGSFALPGDVQSQPLERIEPRQPLSMPDETKAEEKAERTLLAQPVALSAGQIRFSGGTIDLEGIIAPSPEKTCSASGGREWPCGMMARTALRNYIGGRALSCTVSTSEWEGTVPASCSRSDHDLALWLVENGWAEAASGSAFEEQAAAARKAKRGIFGGDPRRSGSGAPAGTSGSP